MIPFVDTIILPVGGLASSSPLFLVTESWIGFPGSKTSGILDARENIGLSNVAMNCAFSINGFLNSIVIGFPVGILNGP